MELYWLDLCDNRKLKTITKQDGYIIRFICLREYYLYNNNIITIITYLNNNNICPKVQNTKRTSKHKGLLEWPTE